MTPLLSDENHRRYYQRWAEMMDAPTGMTFPTTPLQQLNRPAVENGRDPCGRWRSTR
jgi:hypothetical protein